MKHQKTKGSHKGGPCANNAQFAWIFVADPLCEPDATGMDSEAPRWRKKSFFT